MGQRLKNYLLLTLITLAFILPGIATLPIAGRDEAHFIQATQQMMDSHNYFIVKFLDKIRYQKPPGINWLQAASVKLFSPGNTKQLWAYRIPSVLGALLAVLLLFYFANDFFDEKTAWLAALLLGSGILFILEAHMALTDAVLLATVVAMQGALWKIYRDANSHQGWAFVFWLALTAGFAVKGVTLLIAPLTILSLSLFTGHWRWISRLWPTSGLLFLVLTTTIWVILLNHYAGTNYLQMMWQKDLLPKLKHNVQGHGAPPGYFLLFLPLAFFPSSAFVALGAGYAWIKRQQPDIQFLIAWIIPTWLFFLFMPTKLPEYVLPLYPPLDILCALGISHLKWRDLNLALKIVHMTIFALWFVAGIAITAFPTLIRWKLSHQLAPIALLSSGILLVGVLLSGFFLIRQRWTRALTTSLITLALGLSLLFQSVLPNTQNLWIGKKIVAWVRSHPEIHLSTNDPLLITGYHEPRVAFLLDYKKIRVISVREAVHALKNAKTHYLLTDTRSLKAIKHLIAKHPLKWQTLKTIRGFQFSDSRWNTIQISRVT